MPTNSDPFALLERADKWYLGGGRATMYAPAFPRFLDTPGYWDEAYFADIRLERLYCLLLLDARARPLTLRRALRRWTPDRLTQLYTVEGMPHLRIQEERVVTPNDTLACRLTVTNSGTAPARLHLLLWSLQTCAPLSVEPLVTTAAAVEHDVDTLSFAHRVQLEGEQGKGGKSEEDTQVFVALGGSRLPESWTVNLADTADTSPLWQTSIFPEKFRNGTLPREMQDQDGANPNGLLHFALHYVLEAEPGGTDALMVGASLGLDRETALAQLRDDMTRDVVADSRASWERYFASVPTFTCDDPYLERYYWYRWYGLRLLTVDLDDDRTEAGYLLNACVMEGIGELRAHTAAAAQCHAHETAWMRDKGLAVGCLLNFLHQQIENEGHADDGFLPGRLTLWQTSPGLYPVNWGAAALQVYYLWGNSGYVRRMYPDLARYAEYCDREWDRDHAGMVDVFEQDETGQENRSRFLFMNAVGVNKGKTRLKGVEATCYLYELQRALAVFARVLGSDENARWWDEKADATREAVRTLMWDKQGAFFKDVDPQTWQLSPVKAPFGFYPFLSDIATWQHLSALRHLTDPQTFGTPYPVPTVSVDDPSYSAQGEWQGKRANRPTNGRVWPLVNSHVADALANAARRLDANLKPQAVDFMQRFIRMMFHDGDPKRPNSYEHYNPQTGMPSLYRGVDEHQQSWVVDLILRHVVGVQPEPGTNGALVIDPLPFDLHQFRAEGIPVRGHLVDVLWDRVTGLLVRVDGQDAAHSPDLQRLEIPLQTNPS